MASGRRKVLVVPVSVAKDLELLACQCLESIHVILIAELVHSGMQPHLLRFWDDGRNPSRTTLEAHEVLALLFAGAPIANMMRADLEIRWTPSLACVRKLPMVSVDLGSGDDRFAGLERGVGDVEFGLVLALVQILDQQLYECRTVVGEIDRSFRCFLGQVRKARRGARWRV